jgi:hypothetical protein
VRPIPLPVKNMAVVREDGDVVNRIEVNTGMCFDNIKQILVSEPIPCPHREGFLFVHVVCFTDLSKPMPLLFTYLYDGREENSLQDFVFINNADQRTWHHISSFTAVDGQE